ncbi:hypothetical protein [Aequorivita echinoideorum]|uniref:Long-chain fatty acid transport protein n=1 Tax=Aequorivita echinoideorum TaxID=1549647 RepID=A0ABS5S4U8_9FLAO|nr:hypothetical protein [Aequorivita echinoideorum]MBT0607424.1 hypothetical protein [Aequorivita echinoideorum]
MFRQIIAGVFILFSALSFAQEGTTSPYSYYGIGILKFHGTAENRAMGGIGVFSDSIHLNLQNPAAYADLRLINFSVGASHKATTQKNEAASQNTSATSLDYLAIGIPMGKFGLGFGLIPYTSVGYDFLSETESGSTYYTGNGGLNKAFLSLAYQVTPELNVGVDANYNFGKIENTATTQREFQKATQVFNRSDLLGFTYNFGAMYKRMLNENLQLSTSLVYTVGTNITSENSRTISVLDLSTPNNTNLTDIRNIAVGDTNFKFPSEFTVGAGIGKPKHWAIAAEYSNEKTSSFTNRSLTDENVSYTNANKARLGGYFIPNYNSFGNYFQRVVYRAGIRFEETGLNVGGKDIDEFGISFGVGLPVGRLFSNVNIGVEVGRRGTTDLGLIQENFVNTFLSFSLNDRWFEKRLYD